MLNTTTTETGAATPVTVKKIYMPRIGLTRFEVTSLQAAAVTPAHADGMWEVESYDVESSRTIWHGEFRFEFAIELAKEIAARDPG